MSVRPQCRLSLHSRIGSNRKGSGILLRAKNFCGSLKNGFHRPRCSPRSLAADNIRWIIRLTAFGFFNFFELHVTAPLSVYSARRTALAGDQGLISRAEQS
jgi:hypothetical protein